MKPINKEIAIKCSNEEDSVSLFEFLEMNGIIWSDGERLSTDKTKWGTYGIDTCYFIDKRNRLCYGDCDCITREMDIFDSVFDFVSAQCDPVSIDISDVL